MVLVASDAGVWGETPIGAYSVSKRALIMLTRMLAVEAGPAGVRVNAVCPGDTEPGMVTTVAGRDTLPDTSAWTRPPLGRLVHARDVAAAVSFLASDEARTITGADLLVDGGMRAALRANTVAAESGRMSPAALVTGGTGGIGSAVVRRLRADGYDVVFCGRDERRGAELEQATGAVFRRADATDRDACDASVEFALERLGRIDLLVANAGILVQGPLADTSDEEFERLVETNLTATFRYGARALRARCGTRAGERWC